MTFTRDNIVGVEFTVKGGNVDMKIAEININGCPLVQWSVDGIECTTPYTMSIALFFLNNGTWIVKNSNV